MHRLLVSFLILSLATCDVIFCASLGGLDWIDVSVAETNARDPAFTPQMKLLKEIADVALMNPLHTVTDIGKKWCLPPNGDVREYLSYAPYWWPVTTCNQSDPNFMRDCDYYNRDGIFNPDVGECHGLAQLGEFNGDVIALSLAAKLLHNQTYATRAVAQMNSFILNAQTGMKPNMQYGQIHRGKNALPWTGRPEGVLDSQTLPFAALSSIVLTSLNRSDWPVHSAAAVAVWFNDMSKWINSSANGVAERDAANNHGTWWACQGVSYPFYAGDLVGARSAVMRYIDNQYQHQIIASGEQPLEAVRTRPFHYRCYNLYPMMYVAKAAAAMGIELFHRPNQYNATWQTAVDFLINVDPKDESTDDIIPLLYNAIYVYGDADGKYAVALKKFKGDGQIRINALWESNKHIAVA